MTKCENSTIRKKAKKKKEKIEQNDEENLWVANDANDEMLSYGCQEM